MLQNEKIDNFVSNCSRNVVQPFVLEVLMRGTLISMGILRVHLEKLQSRGGFPPWGRMRPPTKPETLY